MIVEGDRLPEGVWYRIDDTEKVKKISVAEFTAHRKIVIFAVPGAFTPTCHRVHLPSFIDGIDELKAKGVDEVICLSVNDPFVMKAWGEMSGAISAGILMMADSHGEFTKALGVDFTAIDAGLVARSQRYTMCVEDGIVTHLSFEKNAGECSLSKADTFLHRL